LQTINAQMLKKMFLSGAAALDAKKEWINELNVFPVPDGDTGTNMTMTIMAAAKEVYQASETSMQAVAKAMSGGALKGARGNSGVILSQLFRGFVRQIGERESLDVPAIAACCQKAVETAYKAVMKPKEGTILTVARGMSEKAASLTECDDLGVFLTEILAEGDDVLKHTPDILPVLKQAGVVDSGGQGLMVILRGAVDAFFGREMSFSLSATNVKSGEEVHVDVSNLETSEIRFGYCTEFIIMADRVITEKDEDDIKAYLSSIGDSLVCVADGEIVKIHVHTNDPGLAIQKGLSYGQLSRMKIDNMREEHQERLFKDAVKLSKEMKAEEDRKKAEEEPGPRKPVGFVSVCAGEGLAQMFRELGVDQIIEGGQTMNPSIEDICSAVDKVNADTVFVLPNNSNIILAARQAADITEGKKVMVLSTHTVCEGITAMVNYLPDLSAEENQAAMEQGIDTVKTIEVTYAVRDTAIDGVEIRKDDFMALCGKQVLCAGPRLSKVVREAVTKAVTEDTALISLYYGDSVSEDDANVLADEISGIAGGADISVVSGGQPVYYYFISVE